jgi:hypothetical protein
MILLDTNILSELMRTAPTQAVLGWVDATPATEFYISAITKAEIELGIALLPEGKRKNNLRTAALSMFATFQGRCLSFDPTTASEYAAIVAGRNKAGRPISVEDAQIAAIALTNDMALATRNTKDFELIDRLKLINPWTL